MDIISPLLLGLSSGTACISTCLPLIVPILMGKRTDVYQSTTFIIKFLCGRLITYILLATLISWLSISSDFFQSTTLIAITQLIGAIIMILFAFKKLSSKCFNILKHKSLIQKIKKDETLIPAILGITTAVTLCPPLLTQAMEAASQESLLYTIISFTMFFIGTLPYFLPISLIGKTRNNRAFEIIGRFAAMIVAVIYLVNFLKIILIS